jgi:ABC-type polysaccharide/polyol phosphate export permease
MLFLSGALYPVGHLPPLLRAVAAMNPVSYAVDLMRAALGQPSEFTITQSLAALTATTVLLFVFTLVVFDPERRMMRRDRAARA